MEIGRSKLSQIKVRVSVTEDLVIDILSRLPAKALLRFRCVSKQWDALPKSSYFAAIHHRRSNPNVCILLRYKFSQSHAYCTGVPGIPLYSIGLLGSKATFSSLDISFLELSSRISYVDIVGSSRGLVCLRLLRIFNPKAEDPPRTIRVWNPATKQFRSPPDPKLLGNIPSSYEYSHFDLGFRFINDDVTDYKLVALVVGIHRGNRNRVYQAHVFTRSTNCWREVKNFHSCVLAYFGNAITLNGAMYWLSSHQPPQFLPSSVLCFDLRDEVFHTIELPSLRGRGIEELLSWKNSLAFTATYDRQLDIWVMTDEKYEVGKQVSWAKQFSILLSPEFGSLIGVWKNQCLFEARDSIESVDGGYEEGLFLCDPTTSRNMKVLPIPEHEKGFKSKRAVSYVESLFPV